MFPFLKKAEPHREIITISPPKRAIFQYVSLFEKGKHMQNSRPRAIFPFVKRGNANLDLRLGGEALF